ncbi:reverse transcriptase [Globisporangium polare]
MTSFNRAVHKHHEWSLSEQGAILTHHDQGFQSHTNSVETMSECERVASSHVPGGKAKLHSHPHHTRIVYLWHSHEQWRPRRGAVRHQVRAYQAMIGEEQRDNASGRGDHSDLLVGLDMLKWKDTRRVIATNAYVAQSLYRLKANRFPLWNRAAENLSCPLSGCSDTAAATVKHTFWECPEAQRWWSSLTALWSQQGINLGSDAVTWIFGLELPNAPQKAWNAVAASFSDASGALDMRQHLLGTMTMMWRAQVAESIHGIWNERLRQIDDAKRDANIRHVTIAGTHQRVLRRVRTLATQRARPDASAADEMTSVLVDFLLAQAEPATVLSAPVSDSSSLIFILFFDGGSRGNPGPRGSGSVILRVNPNNRQATATWVASMAYANRRTTNNVAEY